MFLILFITIEKMMIFCTDAEAQTPNTLATWCEELTHWKIPWCWERLKVKGEGDNRGWYGWMASPTQWAWVWANSGSWWWTGRPVVLQSMRLQRVWQLSELNWAWSVRNSTLGISFRGLQYHVPCTQPFLDVGSMGLLRVGVPYAHPCKSPLRNMYTISWK